MHYVRHRNFGRDSLFSGFIRSLGKTYLPSRSFGFTDIDEVWRGGQKVFGQQELWVWHMYRRINGDPMMVQRILLIENKSRDAKLPISQLDTLSMFSQMLRTSVHEVYSPANGMMVKVKCEGVVIIRNDDSFSFNFGGVEVSQQGMIPIMQFDDDTWAKLNANPEFSFIGQNAHV